MIRNPSHERKELRDMIHKKFLVVIVVKDDSQSIQQNIYEFCKYENIPILYRQYNSLDNEEDQDYIMSLPAVHLYNKNNHLKTYHMNEDIIHCIRLEISKYEMKKYTKKTYWSNPFKYMFRTNSKSKIKMISS